MNPGFPKSSGRTGGAPDCAVLGELSADEAATVRRAIDRTRLASCSHVASHQSFGPRNRSQIDCPSCPQPFTGPLKLSETAARNCSRSSRPHIPKNSRRKTTSQVHARRGGGCGGDSCCVCGGSRYRCSAGKRGVRETVQSQVDALAARLAADTALGRVQAKACGKYNPPPVSGSGQINYFARALRAS